MLLRITAILFPIFAIVGAGYFYGRRHRPEMAVANRLNMDVFVPALVFSAMAGKTFELAAFGWLALGALVLLLAMGALAWPLAGWMGVQRKTFVPPMMFNNSGNIGLPLALLTWGEAALPAAVILFMVENTLHFSLGAKMLDPSTRLLQLWRIPVVAAAVAGLAVAVTGVQLWQPLLIAIRMLGDVSIPLLLFALGVRLTGVSFADWKVAAVGATLRPLAGMALAWVLAQALQLPPQQAAMLLVYGALPPAVLNFLFAERYRQEPERVASIVLIGNLGALVFLPLALAIVL